MPKIIVHYMDHQLYIAKNQSKSRIMNFFPNKHQIHVLLKKMEKLR
jgi:hypothetical protein